MCVFGFKNTFHKDTPPNVPNRQRRIAKTDLYFSAEPKPHQKIDGDIMSPEEYNEMREGVRQQCISGVDL